MNKADAALSCIGIAFNQVAGIQLSPEEVIIAVIRHGMFPEDKKAMSLLLLWIEKYSRYVHIERLKNMTKDFSDLELAILKGIAAKNTKKDHRWKTILNKTRKLPDKEYIIENDVILEIKGADPEFSQFGVKVANNLKSHEKKIIPEIEILKNNKWIQNRLRFGTNLRADIVSIRELSLATNAYQAAKQARCSLNASYRNWNELELLDQVV